MPHLSLSLLGPPEFRLDGRLITTFRSDTVRALLAYLAVASGRGRRESLSGLLWPEAPEEVARQNLRQTLSLLRKAIGDRQADPPFLQVTRKTIQLNAESRVDVDVARFTELFAASERHRHRRVDACRPCVERLRQAVELYRGDLLAGFSLPSAPFEQWLVTEREHLHLQALDALHHLAAYHERRGEHERVCHYARRQLQLEPWCEAAHRQLMRALALSDQRGAALSQYERCRRTLMEELGVEPEAQTRHLYAQIERADGSSALQALSRTPPHNLPVPLTPFVGREAMLAEIEGLLEDPECRLLTLVGPGGSGKTRLALEAASRQRYDFQDGVFFVSMASLNSAKAIVPAIAQAVGFSFYRGGNPRQQLLDYLSHKATLLLLDNFEHLLDGAEVATDILRMAPQVKVLVTSRAALNARGERPYFVGGMDYPATKPGALADLTRYSAVELFLSSGGGRWRDSGPTTEDLVGVAQVCRLVEGMPLAILLAAGWLRVLAPSDMAAELSAEMPSGKGRALDLLEAGVRGAPERHRSMRALFDWSWNLLGERERGILRAFSVFRGGCTREAAQAVTGASLRDLRTLVDHSLLQRTDAGRLEAHELLRQYAAERLEQAPGEADAACDRHAAYYATSLEHWAADLKGPRQKAALAEMTIDLDNARAAWAWAARQGYGHELDQGADALAMFYDWQNRFAEAALDFELATEALSGAASADDLRALIKVQAWEARLALQGEAADRKMEQCLAILERPELAGVDTRRERALVLKRMDPDAKRQRERPSDDVIRRCKQSLALYRQVGDPWEVSEVLLLLALLSRNREAADEAVRFAEEGLAIARAIGHRRLTAFHLLELAAVANSRGQLEKAEHLSREIVALFRETGSQFQIALGLGCLGNLLHDQGRFAESRLAGEESAQILDELGRRQDSMEGTELWLGAAETHLGLHEQAREHLQSYLAMVTAADIRPGMGLAHLHLAEIALATGGYDQAEALLRESLAEIGSFPPLRYEVLSALACNALQRGQGEQAKGYAVEALRIASDPDHSTIRPPLLPVTTAARLLRDGGHSERAVELYALASSHAFVANSHWFHEIAGRHIAAAAESLPLEVVAAAQERGRARDLWETAKELLEELTELKP